MIHYFKHKLIFVICRLKGSGSLDAIQIIKIQGGSLEDSFLDQGQFLARQEVEKMMIMPKM
jgi:T-complex protein 1 subunit beta